MLSQLRNQVESWWQKTPLPVTTTCAETRPRFQKWHRFHKGHWAPLPPHSSDVVHGSSIGGRSGLSHEWAGTFRLVSWNVNADAPSPACRMSALLRVVETTSPEIDIIFLQEVSKDGLTALLSNAWIQQRWHVSEADSSSPFATQKQKQKQLFTTVTLISTSYLATHSISLGAIWRAPLPSHFERDALCCDLLINPSSTSRGRSLRIRLINVHLDSLPINPSRRPQQLSLVASYLYAAACGLVAGDFNPVLPEDDTIIASTNGLVDAWPCLHPTDPGFTWGVYGQGERRFPPNRFDKVALFNLTPSIMRVLPTSTCSLASHGDKTGKGPGTDSDSGSRAYFSDHFGLFCEFGWAEHLPNAKGLFSSTT